VIRQHAPRAQDFTNRRYRHRGVVDEVERAKNRTKSKVRARVEHSIGIIKRVFGFAKVRYRGLKKNTHRLLVTCALANLFRRVVICCAAPGGRQPATCPYPHINNQTRPHSVQSPVPLRADKFSLSILLAPTLVQTFPNAGIIDAPSSTKNATKAALS
jgi:hypothetical protein